jgi:aminopeptidase N
VIELRVHASRPYRVLGSGLVVAEPASDAVQRFTLDTERDVSSITVLLVAAPADDVRYEERTVAGVPVRLASITDPTETAQAFDDTAWVLQQLEDDFGPLPMPRGLSILLHDDYGGGMEYFGGTISDGWALPHELVHMYFGTSTVARTWRDTWWDEAINIWYLWPWAFEPVGPGFGSDIVSGRTAVQPSFDQRAYDEGAAVFELVAERVGGREALIEALAAIRDEHTFAPFTTVQLVGFLEEQTGVDLSEEFGRWVYGQ